MNTAVCRATSCDGPTRKSLIEFEDAPECVVEGLRPLVPPGIYTAVFDTWRTVLMFGGHAAKVVLVFALLDEQIGTRLERFYNVRRLIGKPRPRGRFVVGAYSDFAREFTALTHSSNRLDRLAPSALENRGYKLTVRTVTMGANQLRLPAALQYSVIAKVETE